MYLALRFAYITALLATTPDGFFSKEMQKELAEVKCKKNEPLFKKEKIAKKNKPVRK